MRSKKWKSTVSFVLAAVLCLPVTSFDVHAEENEVPSVYATESMKPIDKSTLVFETNSEHTGNEIANAFDNDASTFWDAAWQEGDKGYGEINEGNPIKITVTFDAPKVLKQFTYLSRQDGNANGYVIEYDLIGIDAEGTRIPLKEKGTWTGNASEKSVSITETTPLASVEFSPLKGAALITTATAAELTFYESQLMADISQKSMVLKAGEKKTLSLSGITGSTVAWTSSNPEIATVSETGEVTGVKEGPVTISAVTDKNETAACEVSVSAAETPQIEGKTLVFEDNFDGDALDMSKWNNWCVDLKEAKPFRYGNSPEVALVPENAYVKDGSLRLLGSKEETTFDGITSNYRMGAVQTRDKFVPTYGYMETMIKIPDVPGSNPAIWTMPQADEENGGWLWGDRDNFGAEIDILERPHPKGAPGNAELEEKYWVTMHYDNYEFTNHTKFHTKPTIKNPYQWHKFAMDWSPEKIDFILDGKVVATQSNDVPNMPEIFILSYGLGGWIGTIADEYLPAEMEVDYIRWYQNNDEVIESTVTLNKTELTMQQGDSETLTAAIGPVGVWDKVVEWKSSKPEIVEADGNGKLTALSAGSSTITVTTEKGKTASCEVTVEPKVSVSVNPASVSLKEGASAQLEAVITPAGADKVKSWTSSNEAAAKVDSATGKVTGVKAGTADITVTTEKGTTAVCKVTVTAEAKLVSLSGAVIQKIAAQKDTGKALKPSLKVTVGNTTLKAGTDYQAAYSKNTKPGTASVKVTGIGKYTGSKTAAFEIIASKGRTYTVGSFKYKISDASTNGKGTAALTAPVSKKLSKAEIPEKVKIGNRTYNVTEIAANAFKGCTSLKSVVIGKNVTKIGSNAFYGCKKLSSITIRSLKVKTVEKNALKGINTKAVIAVPASKASSYARILKGKGQSSKVQVRKDITTLKVGRIKDQKYTGKTLKPSVKIVDGKKTLKAGKDYKITYSKNKSLGQASVKITGAGSYYGTISTSFKIVAVKGKTYSAGNFSYKVTNAATNGKGTVTLTAPKKKSYTSIKVPDTVKIGSVSYLVTAIQDNAFKSSTKISKAEIGKNVTTIGKSAFYGCKNLKSLTVKSTKLKSVGPNALKGINKSAKIKVPSSKLSAYKKLFKGKGQPGSVVITK